MPSRTTTAASGRPAAGAVHELTVLDDARSICRFHGRAPFPPDPDGFYLSSSAGRKAPPPLSSSAPSTPIIHGQRGLLRPRNRKGEALSVFTRKAWKVRLIAAGAGLVGVSLYIGVVKLPAEKAQHEALHSGQQRVASGKITQKWTREGRHADDLLVKCQFRDANGQLREIENQWYASRWCAATTGQAVQVRYSPDHPEQGMTEEALEMIQPDPRRQWPLLAGMGLFGALCWGSGSRSARSRWRACRRIKGEEISTPIPSAVGSTSAQARRAASA